MPFSKKLSALALAVLATASQAGTFNFSYTFSSGDVVNGSFDGTGSGNLVTGLSHVRAFFNGIALNSGHDLYHGGFNPVDGSHTTVPAVVSFDPQNNNFWFSDAANGILDLNHSFVSSTTIPMVGMSFFIIQVSDQQQTVFDLNLNPDNWSLTEVQPVPEPESYAMLLAGLGVMGAVARRRKATPT